MSTASLRNEVLVMYRTLIRLSRQWTAKDTNQTGVEKGYILDETRRLFKANKNLKTNQEISERIREAEARLYMAEHYRNPYPRPVNLPPRSFTKREGKKIRKSHRKIK